MKKVTILSFLVIIIFIASSCIGGSRTGMLNRASDEEIANEKLIRIVEYIENEDEEALKAMFSKRALDEAVDFSNGAKTLFDFYEGKMVSWEYKSGPHVRKSANNGQIIKEVNSYYYIETDKESYFFLINDFQVDDSNADNEGVNMLLVVLTENRLDVFDKEKEILFKEGKKISPPGIYLPILD